MKIVNRKHLAALLLAVLAGSAYAHPGHGAASFFEGVSHPLGWDHLLAMVAVGMWSVLALPARQTAAGPAAFLLMMAVGALAGMAGWTGPGVALEPLMAFSVVLLAVMLLVPLLSSSSMAKGLGLSVVAASALLHGLAHGMEAPVGQVTGYFWGFVLSTAAIHLVGVLTAVGVRQAWSARTASLVLGTALGGAGVVLLGQLA